MWHKRMHEVKTIPSLLSLLAQEEWSFSRNRTPGFASMFSSALKRRSSCQLHCFASLLDREHILFLEIKESIMQTCEEQRDFSYWLDWEKKIKGSHKLEELLRGEWQVVLHVRIHIPASQILPKINQTLTDQVFSPWFHNLSVSGLWERGDLCLFI